MTEPTPATAAKQTRSRLGPKRITRDRLRMNTLRGRILATGVLAVVTLTLRMMTKFLPSGVLESSEVADAIFAGTLLVVTATFTWLMFSPRGKRIIELLGAAFEPGEPRFEQELSTYRTQLRVLLTQSQRQQADAEQGTPGDLSP